jgi:hypothetical protein
MKPYSSPFLASGDWRYSGSSRVRSPKPLVDRVQSLINTQVKTLEHNKPGITASWVSKAVSSLSKEAARSREVTGSFI